MGNKVNRVGVLIYCEDCDARYYGCLGSNMIELVESNKDMTKFLVTCPACLEQRYMTFSTPWIASQNEMVSWTEAAKQLGIDKGFGEITNRIIEDDIVKINYGIISCYADIALCNNIILDMAKGGHG